MASVFKGQIDVLVTADEAIEEIARIISNFEQLVATNTKLDSQLTEVNNKIQKLGQSENPSEDAQELLETLSKIELQIGENSDKLTQFRSDVKSLSDPSKDISLDIDDSNFDVYDKVLTDLTDAASRARSAIAQLSEESFSHP